MVQMLYLYQPHALRNSSLSGTVRAEPVGVLTEFCFTYRFHDLQNTLLYDPIYDSWNSQRSGLSIGLWYLHSPYGSWMIITELFPYEMDVFFLVLTLRGSAIVLLSTPEVSLPVFFFIVLYASLIFSSLSMISIRWLKVLSFLLSAYSLSRVPSMS